MKPAAMLPGERARAALSEPHKPVRYLAARSARANVSPQIVDVTGERPSSGFAHFLAGAACAVLILTALYFSL